MKTYFRILGYVKRYWKHLTISVICTILFSLLNGASIYLTIPLLDTLFQDTTPTEQTVEEPKSALDDPTSIAPEAVTDFIDGLKQDFNNYVFQGETDDILLRMCVLILFAFLGKNLFGYLQAYFMAYVEQGIVKDIRNDAYFHLHKLPMSYFKSEKTGNLISRITNDINIVQGSVSAVFLNLVREPLTIAVFIGIALSISVKLTLFAFVVLPFSLVIIAWLGLILRKQSSQLQAKMADITTILHETISGVKIVKAFTMEDYENKKFLKETWGYFKLTLKMARIRNLASPTTEFLSVIVGVIIIYYGGHLVLNEKAIKASEFLGFLFAIFQLMRPIKELSGVNNRIQETSAAADRVFEIMDTEPNIKNAENPIHISELKESLEFDKMSFKYHDSETMVLDNITFTVNRGEIVALVGSSGAGKTTMVDLIPRFFDPVSGTIKVDGVDYKQIDLKDLRSLMGIVTQETVLFNESVRNNIAYGLTGYPEEKIIEAAKAANAHKFIEKLPNGYDTVIGEKGTKLSGGQRQRISIARALLKNPPVMIFDEATSALDNESEVLVQEAIERLMKERTTIVIAHRLSTIRNADKIIVLDRGKIVQVGKHEELLTDEDGIYKKLYELQFRN